METRSGKCVPNHLSFVSLCHHRGLCVPFSFLIYLFWYHRTFLDISILKLQQLLYHHSVSKTHGESICLFFFLRQFPIFAIDPRIFLSYLKYTDPIKRGFPLRHEWFVIQNIFLIIVYLALVVYRPEVYLFKSVPSGLENTRIIFSFILVLYDFAVIAESVSLHRRVVDRLSTTSFYCHH